jgi:hypothetical protein
MNTTTHPFPVPLFVQREPASFAAVNGTRVKISFVGA